VGQLAAIVLFVRVVETGSFSRAAAGSGLTQPTVSKQVAALELRLKTRLLNRTTRSLTLTEAGAAYYERCKRIQEELDAADSIATLTASTAQGRLRVGSSVAFGRQVIAPMVLEFARRYPDIRIDLSFEDRYVDLLAQNLDVAIRMGRLADSTLGALHLGDNPWVLVATPQYLKQHGAPRRPTDLKQHNCLVYSSVQGDDVWRFTGPRGDAHQVAIRGSLRANNLSTIHAAVMTHMGLAILPRYVVRDDLAQKSVTPLLSGYSLASQEIHAVYPSPRYLPAKARVFVEFLRETFADPRHGFVAAPKRVKAKR
jgi:DNA-binding transcriptional LysR family regulator